jgi:lipopolysaccharide export LptBFGC system permease protein LptF
MSTRYDEPKRKQDESTAELVKDLSREVSMLVRQEVAHAKAEMTQKGKKAGIGAGMLSGAAVLGLAAVGGSMAFFILLLDLVTPAWLAALIITILYAAAAGILALRGKERISEATPPAPEQTIESVKEDVQWAKSHATSNDR